jgi:hypothetical protein
MITKIYATAPSAWASYLINNDHASYDATEIAVINEWIKSVGCGMPVDLKDIGYVKFTDAGSSMFLMASEYVFFKKK